MNPEEQIIFDVISQVTEWEEIPLQTRRDFLAHLLEINTLDEKAINFISETLNSFANQENARLIELQQDLANYQAYISREAQVETSWKHRIYEAANTRVQSLGESFKSGFRTAESFWMKSEESDEHQIEKNEVEALKAGLMA
jgi:hypothetical protein